MSDKAAKLRVVQDIRPVVSAFTAAAGFMRGIAIKRFAPKSRLREFSALEQNQDSHRTRCQLFREKAPAVYRQSCWEVLFLTPPRQSSSSANCYANMARSTI